MKTTVTGALLSLAALILTACGTPQKTTAPEASTGLARPAAVAPTAEALLALDHQATAAYLSSDAKFFEATLGDKFVTREAGRQMDKAATVQWIASNKCEVKDWKLEDPQMAKVAADLYVLSYRGTFNGSCTTSDGTAKIPSPIRGATVWMRAGDAWQAVFHGQDPIFDANNPPPPAKVGRSKETKKHSNAVPATNSATDPNTAAMMSAEINLWEAWKDKDGKKIEQLTTPDLSFQNIFGTFFPTRAEALKNWTSSYCDIKKVSVADGSGTMLSPTIGMLSRTGTAEGTCNGQYLPPMPIYGVSIYVKEGDSWNLAFSLNRLD